MQQFDPLWPFSSGQPELHESDVHVWRVSLEQPASTIQNLRAVLNNDELQRADRFRFPKHARHFTVARGPDLLKIFNRQDSSIKRQ